MYDFAIHLSNASKVNPRHMHTMAKQALLVCMVALLLCTASSFVALPRLTSPYNSALGLDRPVQRPLCRAPRRDRAVFLRMVEDKEEGKGGLAASEAMYFSTRVSEKGNPKLLYDLIRNQILLGASCVWTLSG